MAKVELGLPQLSMLRDMAPLFVAHTSASKPRFWVDVRGLLFYRPVNMINDKHLNSRHSFKCMDIIVSPDNTIAVEITDRIKGATKLFDCISLRKRGWHHIIHSMQNRFIDLT